MILNIKNKTPSPIIFNSFSLNLLSLKEAREVYVQYPRQFREVEQLSKLGLLSYEVLNSDLDTDFSQAAKDSAYILSDAIGEEVVEELDEEFNEELEEIEEEKTVVEEIERKDDAKKSNKDEEKSKRGPKSVKRVGDKAEANKVKSKSKKISAKDKESEESLVYHPSKSIKTRGRKNSDVKEDHLDVEASLRAASEISKKEKEESNDDLPMQERMGNKVVFSTGGKKAVKSRMKSSILPLSDEIKEKSPFIDDIENQNQSLVEDDRDDGDSGSNAFIEY